jgi:Glycosyl hydrolases family 39
MLDSESARAGHRARRRRLSLAGLIGIALAGSVVFALLGFARGPVRADRVEVTLDRAKPIGVSRLQLGVTHTQHSADSWNDPAAVSRARGLLSDAAVFQNQHIMGWGAGNPEISPGHYDFGSLDARVALMKSTGATPVITLCCAPDWMKGGQAGSTDWSKLAEAPDAAHYADFAALAAAVAQRYPDVRYFQVWNELKGFWRSGLHRYDYEGYTQLYNDVYDAVKAVRPDAQIGGPYAVISSWSPHASTDARSSVRGPYGSIDQRPLDAITYWLAHKHGADFITLDAGTDNKDGASTGAYTGAQKFADVASWLRKLPPATYPGARTLPLWWAEWKVETSPVSSDLTYLTSIIASGLATTLRSGASVALIWGAQGDTRGIGDPEGLFTDTRDSSGGAATPLADVMRGLRTRFPPGTRLVQASASSHAVDVLASARDVMLVNRSSHAQSVRLGGQRFQLAPYGVLFARVG